jgi:LmbE family N-acetylglucosaminyl deacetylase
MRMTTLDDQALDPTPVRRLIVAPHADDEALGCGGLLAKYPDECSVVVLAKPDDVRQKEFVEAQRVLGYRFAFFLDQPDGSVGEKMHDLVGMLDRVMNVCRPEELYLPYPSVHQDHVAAYEAGVRSARLSLSAGHWFPPTVMVYDVAAYDLQLYPTDLRWNFFEALDESQVDRKIEAVRAYASQQVHGPHPLNGIKQGAHALGCARQVAYAEQFALVRAVRAGRDVPSDGPTSESVEEELAPPEPPGATMLATVPQQRQGYAR